ncbi:hypothetical protein [Solemya velum gill symbiont]|nr:hypothetical protein [Solemya velum gill symbiont]
MNKVIISGGVADGASCATPLSRHSKDFNTAWDQRAGAEPWPPGLAI